jgi:hypothetical protein
VETTTAAPMEAASTAHMTTTTAVLGKDGYGREGKQN